MNWITDADPDLPIPTDFTEANKATESTNTEELVELSKSKDPAVRAQVAANQYTPDWVLERFLSDTDFVKFYLIRNPSLSLDIIKKISQEENKRLKLQACNILLDRFKKGTIDLNDKDFYELVVFLAPQEPNLSMIEIMESIRDIRERNIKMIKDLIQKEREQK